MIHEEVKGYIEEQREVLTNEKSEEEEDDEEKEETETEPAMWALGKFGEVLRIAQTLKQKNHGRQR